MRAPPLRSASDGDSDRDADALHQVVMAALARRHEEEEGDERRDGDVRAAWAGLLGRGAAVVRQRESGMDLGMHE